MLYRNFSRAMAATMPPMGDIFTPQELADVEAYVLTLK